MKTTLLVSLAVMLLLQTQVAQACSCINTGQTEREKIAAAYQQDALIFVGRVLSVETEVTTDTVRVSGTGPAGQPVRYIRHEKLRYTFAVSRQLKGRVSGSTVLVSTATQSASCGRQFRIGSKQLVYAFLVSQEASAYGGEPESITPYYATSLCNRGQELKHVKRAELKQLARLAKTGR